MNAPVQPVATSQVQPGHEPAPARPSASVAPVTQAHATPAVTTGATPADPTGLHIPIPAASLPQLPPNTAISATVGQPLPGGRVFLHIQSPQQLTLQVPWPNPPAPGLAVTFRLTLAGQNATLDLLRVLSPAPEQHGLVRTTTPGPSQRPAPAQVGDLLRGAFQPAGQSQSAAQSPNAIPANQVTPTPTAGTAQPTALRILAINAPAHGQSVPSPAAGQPTPTQSPPLTGTAGSSPSVLHTASGIITLHQPHRLPVGTQVLFRVESGALLTNTPGSPSPLGNLSNALPSLHDALQLLAAAAPGEANVVRDTVLPTTGPRLATGMLFFISALTGGALQGWLGETAARLLQRVPTDARSGNLADEFTHLSRAAGESLNGDWRAMALPLFHAGTLANLRLFIHRDGHGDSADTSGVRFVVEADLTQLGPIQLDGLVRDEKNFDLTLRSTRPLASQWRDDLCALFVQAGVAADFAGHLSFEVLPALPTPALAETPHGLGVFA